MAVLERTPVPGPPQAPPTFRWAWTVGHLEPPDGRGSSKGAVLALSSARRSRVWPSSAAPAPAPHFATLVVTAWAVSVVPGEGPPVPGWMGQANGCCCGSRWALPAARGHVGTAGPRSSGVVHACCSLLCREALSEAEAVLSADVRLSRGRRRSERRLLLLQEELMVAKLRHGITLHPQLCLGQLWVLSGGKEVAGEEEEEEEGSAEDSTAALRTALPSSSCGPAAPASPVSMTQLPSLKVVEKELSCRRAWRTFSTRSLERLLEDQAKADPKQGPVTAPSSDAGGLCSSAAGGSSSRRRRRGLPWPFALWRSLTAAQAPGQAGSGRSRVLFGQPLAAICREEGMLPQPIQELLAVLHKEGPTTEGIFRKAASGMELRELQEALDHGKDVDLQSQPAILLAGVLKEFLRSIPGKLLVTHLYEDWMQAMERTRKEAKVEELKAVAKKMPAANLLLLKQLLSLLQHIGTNVSISRRTSSNLAICLGLSLLSPPNEELLLLEAMLEVTKKVNVLVEFMVEQCRDIFEEEVAGVSCPSAEESPTAVDRCTDLRLEEHSGPAGRGDEEHQGKASQAAPSSLLDVLKGAEGNTAVEPETAEAAPALPATTLESAAETLGCLEQLGSLSEDRRFAGSPQDNENGRKRKREEAWAEERESQRDRKRRKRENVFGDGKRRDAGAVFLLVVELL
ncbi:T-cell activation Rho GTPase-activating protein-like [Nyctibius grandis]|uniref:T-cell activation Rho GTPase-activating protein-like n=1 Tax=Nyctibius grandis TaxID=48427 RepID=UPI0035BBCE93